MTEHWEIKHTIDLDTVARLNVLLKGSGWTVGKICHEFSILEIDISALGTDAYYANVDETKEIYERKQRLEEKRDAILRG